MVSQYKLVVRVDVSAALNNHPQALAPDGGFVFATVHDIQANVPPKRKPLWIPASLPGTYCTRPASRP